MQKYLEPRFSAVYGNRTTFLHRQLTNTDLSFGPFKEWYFANNTFTTWVVIKMVARAPGTWVWYRYRYWPADEPVHERLCEIQWQNYGAANENEWDGYRFKINTLCRLPICGAVS